MSSIISDFGLTAKQTALLFSAEYLITEADIYNKEKILETKSLLSNMGIDHNLQDLLYTKVIADIKIRKRWISLWHENMTIYIKNMPGGKDCYIAKNLKDFFSLANEVKHNLEINTPLYLILLECVLFTPYYLFDKDKFNTKELKRIEFLGNEIQSTYEIIANALGINTSYIKKFKDSYSSAVNGLTGKWFKILICGAVGAVLIAITAGCASTLIGTMFAAGGLYGAAAAAAGLAALGGGAVAAGGFGVAGGIAVIVGGGALLGAAAGSGIGMLLVASPDLVLHEAAKLEVVMKEIIIGVQHDFKKMQEILHVQNEQLFKLKMQLMEERNKANTNNEKIKNMEKCIEILEKLCERNGA